MIRASRLTARPLTARRLTAYKLGQTGPFDPLILFRNAEEGTFLDFTTPQVYADTAGTDPAEVGEGVALILDQSQGGVPRRNLNLYSEDFSNPVWANTATTITDDATTAPDGTETAQSFIHTGTGIISQAITVSSGITVTRSVYVKENTGSGFARLIVLNGGNSFGGWFNTSTGEWETTVAVGTSVLNSTTVQSVGNGWYRISVTGSIPATTSYVCWHYITDLDNSSTRSSTVSQYWWGAQLEVGDTATAYQKITTGLNGEWTPGNHITQATSTARPIFRLTSGVYSAEFDLTDDILPITLPAITGGTVALVGLNGIWIEEDWDYAGGTLNIGPTTIAGLPAGILDVVGGLCAVIINDRAWTAAERAGVVAWGKARGAPGVFSLGEELVVNGTFDSDTDWTKGTGASITGGVLVYIGNAGGSTTQTTQNAPVTTETGEAYVMRYSVSGYASGSMTVRAGGVNSITTIANGDYYQFISAIQSSAEIRVGVNTNFAGNVDNISVRKLELIP